MIYVDYAATTPVDPRVVDALLPFMTNVFFNASSTHTAGLEAKQAVMRARYEVAKHVGATMDEVVFTSGATEAISLAVLGLFRQAATPERNEFVTCVTEHAAMLDVAKQLEREGFVVHRIGVDMHGEVRADDVRAVVTDRTLLLSVMAVNNETGVKQNLRELSDVAHAAGAFFMTDATQAYGKMPLDVNELGIDLMSFSGHKIYGPKGIGVLYRRISDRPTSLQPLQFGGGQEGGIRSGTLNVPGIVGLAKAGSIALEELEQEATRVGNLRLRFEEAMTALGATINGSGAKRSYNISNVTFPHLNGHLLQLEMEPVACSQGSACSSTKTTPSHVLTAMGCTPEQTECSLRFSFGRYTTDAEVDELISLVQRACSTVHHRATTHPTTANTH